jgi:DNA polymerase-1
LTRASRSGELDAELCAGREQAEAFWHQVKLEPETLRADGFPTWEAEGFEADDLAATGVERARMSFQPLFLGELEAKPWPVVIVSSDKDLLALVNDNVHVKSATSGNVLDETGVIEKFGVRPDQMTDFLTLVGDASDGVKGVKDIGAKNAAALLNRSATDDLYAAIDRATPD